MITYSVRDSFRGNRKQEEGSFMQWESLIRYNLPFLENKMTGICILKRLQRPSSLLFDNESSTLLGCVKPVWVSHY